jgi:hypothetical protein
MQQVLGKGGKDKELTTVVNFYTLRRELHSSPKYMFYRHCIFLPAAYVWAIEIWHKILEELLHRTIKKVGQVWHSPQAQYM